MAKLKQQKDWEALDISALRGRARNRVYRVGLELEGGWSKLPPGVRLAHDGSVRFQIPVPHIGEFPSGVLDIAKGSPTFWQTWLKINYPQFVNETCGMHVHLSFKTAFAYNRIMTAQYPATVVKEFIAWAKREELPVTHPIWPRLAGQSRYCQHKFDADAQVRNIDKDHNQERVGHRYTVINYCYGRYSTAECRLLPMMDTVERATRAIQELLDITNAFLVALPVKREPKQKIAHECEDGLEQVETRLYV